MQDHSQVHVNKAIQLVVLLCAYKGQPGMHAFSLTSWPAIACAAELRLDKLRHTMQSTPLRLAAMPCTQKGLRLAVCA